MAYEAEISRANPSCFMFLIDQSGSMGDPFGGPGGHRRKADGVADAINRLLQNLTLTCAKSEGIRDYYLVTVLRYGSVVGPALGGVLSGQTLVPMSQVADNPIRLEERRQKIEDGAGGLVEETVKTPIWFEPVAKGGTPMCEALREGSKILDAFVAEHPESFPPIVVNISDGEATDGDPTEAAAAITEHQTADGHALLFNLHLSSSTSPSISFPSDEASLPDQHGRLLFEISSSLPPPMRSAAKSEGFAIDEGARGLVFNADMVKLVQFLDIGTRPGNLR